MQTTQKQRDEIYRLRFEEEKTWAEIAPFFPEIPRASLRRIGHREAQKRGVNPASVTNSAPEPDAGPPQPKEKLTISHNEDGTVTAESRSETIKTLEQLIEVAEIDLDRWQVVSWIANVWQQAQKNPDNPDRPIMVNLHQVKASLRPIHTAEAVARIEDMREELREFAPVYPKIRRPSIPHGEGHLLEIAVPDLHLGKLAWEPETGRAYGMDKAEQLFRNAVAGLVERARFAQIERILLPLGNDLFHVNSGENTTKRGTRQDVDGQLKQHFRRVRQMIRDVVDELVQVAPVTLMFVPGNHDEDPVFYLGEALYDWYYNAEYVEVINAGTGRQYFAFGKNLIGFTHGDKEKGQRLAQLMPVEVPKLWAASTFREFHTGHLHIRRETQYLPLNEFGGIRVRVLPSLCEVDKWHFDNGYAGSVRAAEGYLWHSMNGLTAQLSWFPSEAD